MKLTVGADEMVVLEQHAVRCRNAVPAASANAKRIAGEARADRPRDHEGAHGGENVAIFDDDVAAGQQEADHTGPGMLAHCLQPFDRFVGLKVAQKGRRANGKPADRGVASVRSFGIGGKAGLDDMAMAFRIDRQILHGDVAVSGNERIGRCLRILPDQSHQIPGLAPQRDAIWDMQCAAQAIGAVFQREGTAATLGEGGQGRVDAGGIVVVGIVRLWARQRHHRAIDRRDSPDFDLPRLAPGCGASATIPQADAVDVRRKVRRQKEGRRPGIWFLDLDFGFTAVGGDKPDGRLFAQGNVAT